MAKNDTPPTRKTFEAWAEDRKPAAWLAAAAKAMRGWVVGQELTADEFDQALEAAGAIRIGYDIAKR